MENKKTAVFGIYTTVAAADLKVELFNVTAFKLVIKLNIGGGDARAA